MNADHEWPQMWRFAESEGQGGRRRNKVDFGHPSVSTLATACIYVIGGDQKCAGSPIVFLHPIYVKTAPVPFRSIVNPWNSLEQEIMQINFQVWKRIKNWEE